MSKINKHPENVARGVLFYRVTICCAQDGAQCNRLNFVSINGHAGVFIFLDLIVLGTVKYCCLRLTATAKSRARTWCAVAKAVATGERFLFDYSSKNQQGLLFRVLGEIMRKCLQLTGPSLSPSVRNVLESILCVLLSIHSPLSSNQILENATQITYVFTIQIRTRKYYNMKTVFETFFDDILSFQFRLIIVFFCLHWIGFIYQDTKLFWRYY